MSLRRNLTRLLACVGSPVRHWIEKIFVMGLKAFSFVLSGLDLAKSHVRENLNRYPHGDFARMGSLISPELSEHPVPRAQRVL